MASNQQEIPLGIRQLMSLDSVLVRQKPSYCEGNKYQLMTPDNKVFMFATENPDPCSLFCGGKSRAFEINIEDEQGKEVINLVRPYTFGTKKMDVAVCGQLASVVRQEFSFLNRVINVNDSRDRPIFRVKGIYYDEGIGCYRIFTPDKRQVAVIRRMWSGWVRELTNVNNFEVVFPPDLDVRFKAALIGTCIFIDYMYYES